MMQLATTKLKLLWIRFAVNFKMTSFLGYDITFKKIVNVLQKAVQISS